jgi:hypothetical protein
MFANLSRSCLILKKAHYSLASKTRILIKHTNDHASYSYFINIASIASSSQRLNETRNKSLKVKFETGYLIIKKKN